MAAFNVLALIRVTLDTIRAHEVLEVLAGHLQAQLGTDAEVMGIHTTKAHGTSALVVFRVQLTVTLAQSAVDAQRLAFERLARDVPTMHWPSALHVQQVEVLSTITASSVLGPDDDAA